jgi:hypothetical protein
MDIKFLLENKLCAQIVVEKIIHINYSQKNYVSKLRA